MFNQDDFHDVNILIVGDSMLDQYWHGNTKRISPEAPVPVVNVQKQEHRAGGAANVALNVAKLGAKVTLISTIGKDTAGEQLSEILAQAKVNFAPVYLENYPTITKLRVLAHNQQLLRCDTEETTQEATDQIELLLKSYLPTTDIVILSDYAKGVLASPQRLIKQCRAFGKKVIIDPKSKDFSCYRGATLLTPNLLEFEQSGADTSTEDALVQSMQACIQQNDLSALLVTRGAKGMSLIEHGKEEAVHIRSMAREVFDVTGAGDTVIGVLATMYAKGFNLSKSVRFANTAASIAVGKLGTAQVSIAELNQLLAQDATPEDTVIDINGAKTIVERQKQQGKQIVFTNGCFDILHAGHIDYLTKAKNLGDFLVIGVNDDDSVKRLKGQARPINQLLHRMQMLAALKMVDLVVPFSEDTPHNLIDALMPDVLCKGGDYQAEKIVGYDIVTQNGGKVEILPFVSGLSTTNILTKLTEEETV